MSDLPTPTPRVSAETETFWEATVEGKLLLCECADCGRAYHYPRVRCPNCFSGRVEWTEAAGDGTIYSYTVTRQKGGPYREASPYVLAYVELDEGPRLLTNVVGVDAAEVSVGQSVTVAFDETDADEGYALPRFTPNTD